MKLNYATVQPGEKIEFKTVITKNTLKVLQDGVDGLVDCVQLHELDIWVNDEGLLLELDPTIIIKNSPSSNLTEYDSYLVGSVVFASSDEDGNTVSLTEGAKRVLKGFRPALLGDKRVMIYQNY